MQTKDFKKMKPQWSLTVSSDNQNMNRIWPFGVSYPLLTYNSNISPISPNKNKATYILLSKKKVMKVQKIASSWFYMVAVNAYIFALLKFTAS